jgi:hypothetical protein
MKCFVFLRLCVCVCRGRGMWTWGKGMKAVRAVTQAGSTSHLNADHREGRPPRRGASNVNHAHY